MNKVIVINYKNQNYKIIRECRINLYPMPVRDSILDMDLYSSIEMCMENGIPFSVANLNEQEFELLEHEIKVHGNLNRLLVGPRYGSYSSCRYMITRSSDHSKILFNDYDNPEKKGTYSFDFETKILDFNQNGIPFTEGYNRLGLVKYGYTNGLKIYTTETYNDVIEYYREFTDQKKKEKVKMK